MRSRRAGRTFEGMLIAMALAILAAVVLPPLVTPDLSVPADGAAVLDLPAAPELATERAVDTGAWVSSTHVRREGAGLVFTTRPALWVRVVVAPALLVLAALLSVVLVTEATSGWRPGGAPRPPGRVGFVARVLVFTVLNPLDLPALGLLVATRRLEVRRGVAQVASTWLSGATDAELVALDEDSARVVVVHTGPDGKAARTGVLTLARGEAGLARAVRDALR